MKRSYWQAVLAVAGMAMIIGGLLDGEWGRVLAKAARLCLECIGLG